MPPMDCGFGQGFGQGFGLQQSFGAQSASYTFTGVPGSPGATAGENVTETITQGHRSQSIVYSPESGNAGVYQITSMTHGGHTSTITPTASSPTFTFGYNSASGVTTIAETIAKATTTETLTYDSSGSSYALASDVVAIDKPTTALPNGGTKVFSFSSTGAATRTVTINGNTYTNSVNFNPTASATGLGTNTVVETFVSGDAVTAKTFTGDPTDGYALAQTATTYIPATGTGPALDIDPYNRVDFNFTDDTLTPIDAQGVAGSAVSLTANSHRAYADLGAAGLSGDFVGETITHGGRTAFELFYSSTGVGGEYMQVASGSGTAASALSNVAAEITALDNVFTLKT